MGEKKDQIPTSEDKDPRIDQKANDKDGQFKRNLLEKRRSDLIVPASSKL